MIQSRQPHRPPSALAQPRWLLSITACLSLVILICLFLSPGRSLLEYLQWLDSGLCAQTLTHVLSLGGERLPLCARNTGIYLGFLITLVTLHAQGRGHAQQLPPRPITLTLIAMIVALAIDGSNSLLLDLGLPHLYPPLNSLRLATGLLTGLALATLLSPSLNRLLCCQYNDERTLSSWHDLARLVLLLAACFLAILAHWDVLLYPIALLSTSGVVIALSTLNLIILVALAHRDQSFLHYREAWPFFCLALTCALGEMLILAQLKLVLVQHLSL